jgi:uncharacterized protein (DUF58 family)
MTPDSKVLQSVDSRVYTSLVELVRLEHLSRGFSLLPRQSVQSLLAGRHASRLRGRGLDFEELRHYRMGDDVRTIDWKATNRTRKPHVRVFTEERDRPVIVVVDQRLSMFFGSRRSMKSVAAAEAAALGIWRVLDQGDRVGAVLFDDTETVEIRPHRSRRRALHILETIVEFNRKLSADADTPPGAHMLNEALARIGRIAQHDFLVYIVTDFAGANDETRERLTRLAWHNDVMACFVFDRIESRLPVAGSIVFGGKEGQIEVDTSDERLRERYAGTFEERIARIRDTLLKRAIPVIPIDAGLPVPEQVRRHIGNTVSARRRGK